MTTASPMSAHDLFQQAMDTFQSAIHTGVKIQEESTKRFTEMLRDCGSPMDWQKKSQSMMNEELYESALNTLRTNTQMILQANTRMLESWTQLAKELTSRMESQVQQAQEQFHEQTQHMQEQFQHQPS